MRFRGLGSKLVKGGLHRGLYREYYRGYYGDITSLNYGLYTYIDIYTKKWVPMWMFRACGVRAFRVQGLIQVPYSPNAKPQTRNPKPLALNPLSSGIRGFKAEGKAVPASRLRELST